PSASQKLGRPGYYALSLHDALPIYLRFGAAGDHHAAEDAPELGCRARPPDLDQRFERGEHLELFRWRRRLGPCVAPVEHEPGETDRKSTRLNSSHVQSSYAVCCSRT